MKDYRLICDEDWTEVENLINGALFDGYIPLGAPFVFTQKNDRGEDQQLIGQAVVRPDVLKTA